MGKTVGNPGIDRHVGKDSRTIDKSRLGRDQKDGRLGNERYNHQRIGQIRRQETYVNFFKQTGVQSLARFVGDVVEQEDRKSTRLNSSHANISYAVFCLKKKK